MIKKAEKRNGFLAKEFGDVIFDTKVFRIADLMIDEYDGGYWEYVYLNDVPFLMLDGKDTLIVRNIFTGQEEECPKELAGLIVTFFALSDQIQRGRLISKINLLNNLLDKIKDICFDKNTVNGRDIWMTILD